MTDLVGLSQEFATKLSEIVSSFVGHSVPFEATTSENGRVTVGPRQSVPLMIEGQQLLLLEIRYRCQLDHAQTHLAVHSSHIKVHAGQRASGEPLFRYEYVKDQPQTIPSAHIQIHAHRDRFTAAMVLAAKAGARRRQAEDPFEVTRLSRLHFPVGGPRFRPGLEDVLHLLHDEFGVDIGESWPTMLLQTRETYRRRQTAAVTRDCPSEAVRVLEELGYTVSEPPSGPAPDRTALLRAF